MFGRVTGVRVKLLWSAGCRVKVGLQLVDLDGGDKVSGRSTVVREILLFTLFSPGNACLKWHFSHDMQKSVTVKLRYNALQGTEHGECYKRDSAISRI